MHTLPTMETFCLGTTLDLIWQDQECIEEFPGRNTGILEHSKVPNVLALGSLCTRMSLNWSVADASDGTDVFGAPWEDLGAVGSISKIWETLEQKIGQAMFGMWQLSCFRKVFSKTVSGKYSGSGFPGKIVS